MQRIDLSDFKDSKTALVLSGGVVKAASWHLGVALALEELGFNFKNNESKIGASHEIGTYVGSSAGALVNLFFASGYSARNVIDAHQGKPSPLSKPIGYREMLTLRSPIKKPPKSKMYDPLEGFPAFLKTVLSPMISISGFFSTNGLQNFVTENVLCSSSFDDYKSDLFVVATQLDNSRKVIFGKYNYPNPNHDNTATYYTGINVGESVAASMSVPPFYSPYPIKNPVTNKTDYYIDGEIRETLSTHVAVDNKCDLILSSWTHTPYHYHDEVGSLVNYGLPAICTQAIYLMIQKKIVSSRASRKKSKDVIETVNQFLKSNKHPYSERMRLTSILERKLDFDPNLKFIDIYPKHINYKVFFRNSFSLNPKNMAELAKLGYLRTMEVFKEREWEN